VTPEKIGLSGKHLIVVVNMKGLASMAYIVNECR